MRLADLHPRWGREYNGYDGQYLIFDCPCPAPLIPCPCGEPTCPQQLTKACGWSPMHIPIANPIDGGPPPRATTLWTRTGETFETLTLSPSIHAVGHWHGFIRNGELVSC